jgi:DNA-binding CsgD family transcriptional regulator
MTTNRVKLSETDRDHLVHAVESATKIQKQEDFHAWIQGEFHALLPNEAMVCVEIDEEASSHLVECLCHNTVGAGMAAFSCDHLYGLSLRLLRSLAGNTPISHLLDAAAIKAALSGDGQNNDDITNKLHNALIHRIEFLSGARYYLVLFNLAQDQAQRSTQIFKLLSSHVKMALSWRVSQREAIKPVALTPRELEILDRMRKGNSNREISALLGINPMTLKSHVAKIYRKLDVQTRSEALLHASSTPANNSEKNVCP